MNEIILVGNPNVGKTTLYNMLTKENQKVSNWHGVTVGSVSKEIVFENEKYKVTDLPGIYSLQGFSNEEKIACSYLKNHKNEIVVNICDANNLKRCLILSRQLIDSNYKVIIAVNMAGELDNIDYKKLEKELNVIVYPFDARKIKDVKKLLDIISNFKNKKTQNKIKNIENKANNLYLYKNKDYSVKFNPYKLTDKIDKIILNKVVFALIFILTLFIIFFITFGPIGECFSIIINYIFNIIFDKLRKIILCTNISYIIKSFIISGVFVGIESVLSFVPQIMLLMFFMNLLEEIGFMSRVAFMFDGIMKKFGLTGKSLFSLFMGFGCTTSAIIASRNLENLSLRKRTVFLLPFMSCSAKLPIFLVISSLFFDKYKYLFVFGLYLFAILISLIFAMIYKKVIPDKNNIFILEMPKYRLPSLKKILKDIYTLLIEFLIKIGTIIILFTIIVWFLQNFSTKFEFLDGRNIDKSILCFVSNKILFLFKPIGFKSFSIITILLLGIVAKEMIVVGIALINGIEFSGLGLSASLLSSTSVLSFDLVSSIVFLVFVLIYSPCFSAILTVKNELGKKAAVYVFVSQFLLAYIISFLVYKFLTDFRFIFMIALFIVLDILLIIVLKLDKKKKCWGNCNACRKI